MFSQMYNKVSKVMDECHIAIKLDEPTLFNMDSKRVDMEEGAYEKKNMLTHPEKVLFVDEFVVKINPRK